MVDRVLDNALTPNIVYCMICTVSPTPVLIPSIPARFGQAVYRPRVHHHPVHTALRCIGLGVSIVIWRGDKLAYIPTGWFNGTFCTNKLTDHQEH